MAKDKFNTIKKRAESLGKRVAHLENEMLRELGDIGDIARQFVLLREELREDLAKVRKDMGALKRKITMLEKHDKKRSKNG